MARATGKKEKKQEEEEKQITKTFPRVVRDRVVKVVSLFWLLLHGFKQWKERKLKSERLKGSCTYKFEKTKWEDYGRIEG